MGGLMVMFAFGSIPPSTDGHECLVEGQKVDMYPVIASISTRHTKTTHAVYQVTLWEQASVVLDTDANISNHHKLRVFST